MISFNKHERPIKFRAVVLAGSLMILAGCSNSPKQSTLPTTVPTATTPTASTPTPATTTTAPATTPAVTTAAPTTTPSTTAPASTTPASTTSTTLAAHFEPYPKDWNKQQVAAANAVVDAIAAYDKCLADTASCDPQIDLKRHFTGNTYKVLTKKVTDWAAENRWFDFGSDMQRRFLRAETIEPPEAGAPRSAAVRYCEMGWEGLVESVGATATSVIQEGSESSLWRMALTEIDGVWKVSEARQTMFDTDDGACHENN